MVRRIQTCSYRERGQLGGWRSARFLRHRSLQQARVASQILWIHEEGSVSLGSSGPGIRGILHIDSVKYSFYSLVPLSIWLSARLVWEYRSKAALHVDVVPAGRSGNTVEAIAWARWVTLYQVPKWISSCSYSYKPLLDNYAEVSRPRTPFNVPREEVLGARCINILRQIGKASIVVKRPPDESLWSLRI